MTKRSIASIIMDIAFAHVPFIWVLYESDVKISFILALYAILTAIWFACYLYKKNCKLMNKKKVVSFIMDNLFLEITYLVMLYVLGASIPFILGLYAIFAVITGFIYWYKKHYINSSNKNKLESKTS